MLRITNHSENYDGAIEVNGKDIAGLNGSKNEDGIYMNFNSYDVQEVKTAKTDVSSDVAEFVEILLTEEASND